MGKSESATFSVVGVDSNTSKIVVEVVIDSCEGQNSLTIFDSIETFEPFSVLEFVVATTEETTEEVIQTSSKLISRRPLSPPATRLTPRRFIIFVPRL